MINIFLSVISFFIFSDFSEISFNFAIFVSRSCVSENSLFSFSKSSICVIKSKFSTSFVPDSRLEISSDILSAAPASVFSAGTCILLINLSIFSSGAANNVLKSTLLNSTSLRYISLSNIFPKNLLRLIVARPGPILFPFMEILSNVISRFPRENLKFSICVSFVFNFDSIIFPEKNNTPIVTTIKNKINISRYFNIFILTPPLFQYFVQLIF